MTSLYTKIASINFCILCLTVWYFMLCLTSEWWSIFHHLIRSLHGRTLQTSHFQSPTHHHAIKSSNHNCVWDLSLSWQVPPKQWYVSTVEQDDLSQSNTISKLFMHLHFLYMFHVQKILMPFICMTTDECQHINDMPSAWLEYTKFLVMQHSIGNAEQAQSWLFTYNYCWD